MPPLVKRGPGAAALVAAMQTTAGGILPGDGTAYMRLRAKIKIDKDDLDTAVVEQPETYLEISEAYSLACSVRDQTKGALARLESELATDCRKTLAMRGLKDTKDNMSDAILLHPKYATAKTALDRDSRIADQWSDLKYSFEQRMRMLRELVQLYAVGYFTTASMRGSAGENRNTSAAIVREAQQRKRDGQSA